jgi:hypothetical protein
MNILNFTGIDGHEAAPEPRIGTPEAPIYVHPLVPVLTGSRAAQSTRDRIAYLDRKGLLTEESLDPDLLLPRPDLLLPRPDRRTRRAAERAKATERRKATRRYIERQRRAG